MAKSKTSVDCSQLSASVSRALLLIARQNGHSTFDGAANDLISILKQDVPNLSRDLVFEMFTEFQESKVKTQITEGQKSVNAVVGQAKTERRLKRLVVKLQAEIEGAGPFLSPAKSKARVTKILQQIKAETAKLGGVKRAQQRFDEADRLVRQGGKLPTPKPKKPSRVVSEEEKALNRKTKERTNQLKAAERETAKIRRLIDSISKIEADIDVSIKSEQSKSNPDSSLIKRLKQRKKEALERKNAAKKKEARVQKRLVQLQDQINTINQKISDKDFSKSAPKEKQVDKREQKLLDKRKERKRVLSLMKSIDRMTKAMESGDFSKPSKKTEVLSAEVKKLIRDRKAVKSEFDQMQRDIDQGVISKVWDETNMLQKAIKATFDASFFGIQLAKPTIIAPLLALSNTGKGIRSIFDGKFANDVIARINENPHIKEAIEMGSLKPVESNAFEDVTIVRSKILERLPLIGFPVKLAKKWIEIPVSRGWNAAVGGMRADLYLKLRRAIAINGTVSQESSNLLGNAANTLTGRGGPNDTGQLLRYAERGFWSPRNMMAQIQFMFGQPLWKGLSLNEYRRNPEAFKENYQATKAARKEIAKMYGKYFIGMAALMGAWELMGGEEVERDPADPNFMKLRTKNGLAIDLDGPLKSMTSFLYRTGRSVARTTQDLGNTEREQARVNKIRRRNDERKMGEFNVARFFRGKSSPIVGTSWDFLTGKTFDGRKLDYAVFAEDQLPISVNDLRDALKSEGADVQAIRAILALLGKNTRDNKLRGRDR